MTMGKATLYMGRNRTVSPMCNAGKLASAMPRIGICAVRVVGWGVDVDVVEAVVVEVTSVMVLAY